MVYLKAGVLCVLAYCVTSTVFFGAPLKALGLLFFWKDRLGLAYWPSIIAVAVVIAIFTTRIAVQYGTPRVFVPAFFVAVSISCSVFLVGFWAEYQRDLIVGRFGADKEVRSSVFVSFLNAPRDFQFFLHGAALKDCVPYAWSYGQMAFYKLPTNAAINVLPTSWIEECNIRRTY